MPRITNYSFFVQPVRIKASALYRNIRPRTVPPPTTTTIKYRLAVCKRFSQSRRQRTQIWASQVCSLQHSPPPNKTFTSQYVEVASPSKVECFLLFVSGSRGDFFFMCLSFPPLFQRRKFWTTYLARGLLIRVFEPSPYCALSAATIGTMPQSINSLRLSFCIA